MNYEDCMRAMDECVVNACEKMKTLNSQDRFHLLLEMGEWIFQEIDLDDELSVPTFKNDLQESGE